MMKLMNIEEQNLEHEQQRRLFDLSLIQPKHTYSNQNHSKVSRYYFCKDEETSSSSVSSCPLPALESLSSTLTDDDNASISSVSTQGSCAVTVQRRSVFSQYWKKTGQQMLLQQQVTVAALSASSATGDDAVCYHSDSSSSRFLSTPPEHEAVLHQQGPPSSPFPAAPVSSPSRRTVLPYSAIRSSYSAPSFSQWNDADTDHAIATSSSSSPRKVRSTSMLNKQPSASCLRQSRFSPNKNSNKVRRSNSLHRENSCGSLVRFDMEAVAVLHFEPPKERYAEEGWADFFQ
jgi:hypothetical protein